MCSIVPFVGGDAKMLVFLKGLYHNSLDIGAGECAKGKYRSGVK